MVFKKKIMALSISFLLFGCSAVENSYESLVLEQTFDSGFTHTINNQNTLEDNKRLLKSIQSDKNVMAMLKKNTKQGSPNYLAFEKYKSLVDLIILEEKKKQTNNKKQVESQVENTTKSSPVTEIAVKKETKSKTTELKKDIKAAPVLKDNDANLKVETKTTNSKKDVPEPITVIKKEKKKTVVHKPKVIETKKDVKSIPVVDETALKTEYLKIRSKLKNNHYVILSHCNVEDAHLLLEDIENYKNKVLSLSNNNTALATYALKNNETEFTRCLDLHLNNQSLNTSDAQSDSDIPKKKDI